MTAIREQIFAEADTRLVPLVPTGEYEAEPAGDPTKYPCLHSFDNGQDEIEEEGEAGTERFLLKLGINGFVETAGDGAACRAALNALYASVIETLFTEPVMGGLAEEIRQGRMDTEIARHGSKRRGAFSLELVIFYATRRGSPQV